MFVDVMVQAAVGFGVPESAVAMMKPQLEATVIQMDVEDVKASMLEIIDRAHKILDALYVHEGKAVEPVNEQSE